MVTDLINRLRECSTYGFKQEICAEAADALERMAAQHEKSYAAWLEALKENQRLREELEETQRKLEEVHHGNSAG